MSQQERTRNKVKNLLSIIEILQEAELQRRDEGIVSEWTVLGLAQTHLIGTTIYGIKRVMIDPQKGVLYCITVSSPEKREARLICLSPTELETQVIVTPENMLERRGISFPTIAQAGLSYDKICKQAKGEDKPFSAYFTS